MAGRRVLLVDDVDGLRGPAVSPAGSQGRVRSAAGGRHRCGGAAVASAGGLDVIVLDERLPDGSGIELAAQLRLVCPAADIALLTGQLDDTVRPRQPRGGGVLACFAKPQTWRR